MSGTLENKRVNLEAQARLFELESAARASVDLIGEGHLGKALEPVWLIRFYGLLPFLGLLLLGPLAMLIARLRGSPAARLALRGLRARVRRRLLVWILLMFGGFEAAAIIHQGSLALPLRAVCACVAATCAVDLRFGVCLVLANVAMVLLLYVPSITPPADTAYSPLAGLLAAADLAGIGFLTLRGPGLEAPSPTNTLPGRDGETCP